MFCPYLNIKNKIKERMSSSHCSGKLDYVYLSKE
jgi:hypothetical protein